MPNKYNSGAAIGQGLGSLATILMGGGSGAANGRLAAQQQQYNDARMDDQYADAELKRDQLRLQSPDQATTSALRELGATGTLADQLRQYAQTGQEPNDLTVYNPNGEVDFQRSGPKQDVPKDILNRFGKALNAYTYAKQGEFKNTQEGLGQSQTNELVRSIADGGYNADIGKALLLNKGKAPFEGGTYHSTDTTSGDQALNELGASQLGIDAAKSNQFNTSAQQNLSVANRNNAAATKYRHDIDLSDENLALKRDQFDRELKLKYSPDSVKTNKPLNELQQFDLDQKRGKKEVDYIKSLSNFDDSISEIEELKSIQDKTPTGPFLGLPPVVYARKLLPDSIGQGSNLQKLEKGYNKAAINAIAAFKASGISFGQLSNKEGEWIKSTTETLNSDGEVNKDMLDNVLKVLKKGKRILAYEHKMTGGNKNSESDYESLRNNSSRNETSLPAKPDDATNEEWAQFLKETGGQ